ncbi:AarF/ABC1/UbiB kinase family protein [Candidatus Woesearchaeota archaeon]|nr:AarF/ABC1/UbiB kinase family protein [Candidatus Woesearchaeota archaeon]
MGFIGAIKRFSRLRIIVELLIKEGFGDVIERLHFNTPMHFGTKLDIKGKKEVEGTTPQRLRIVFEEAGGAFVKLGQMLSLRSDLIPQEYCDEFSKLQDSVKPFPMYQVRKIIQEEFGKSINKIFDEFDETPLAAASVGQVHRAKLKTGEIVAVKIQRPDIKKVFESDIDLMYFIAEEAEKHWPDFKVFKPKEMVKQFQEYTIKEMDYQAEAKNIDVFYNHYKYHTHIKIPKVFWDYTTKRILTMEYIDGRKISVIDDLGVEQKKKIAMLVYKSMLTQVLEMRVFHADPHPGNIFWTKDAKVAFLDFGIVGRLSPDMAENVELMLIGLVKGDLDSLSQGFIEMGVVDDIDENKFKEDLFEAWAEFKGSSLKQMNMKRFFINTFDLARKYEMNLPTNFVLLAKAVITAEAFGKQLYPDSNFVEVCREEVDRIVKKERQPKVIYDSLKKNIFDIGLNLKRFPSDLRGLMKIIRKGTKVKLEVDHKELGELNQELDVSSKRVTYGLIIGGLLIATGLFVATGLEPKYYNIPLLAIISGSISIIMIFMIIISMIKKGGMSQ